MICEAEYRSASGRSEERIIFTLDVEGAEYMAQVMDREYHRTRDGGAQDIADTIGDALQLATPRDDEE